MVPKTKLSRDRKIYSHKIEPALNTCYIYFTYNIHLYMCVYPRRYHCLYYLGPRLILYFLAGTGLLSPP